MLTIDTATEHQTIDGFGASDSYHEPLSDELADFFFSPTTGLGLSILRRRILQTSTPQDPATALKAIARGASKVWAFAISPPAAWKTNGSITNGGSLLPEHYQDWADIIAEYASNSAALGVPLFAVSPQNEPDFTATWESCIYTPTELRDFITTLGPTLPTGVKVLMPESTGHSGLAAMADPALADATARSFVGVTASHSYDGLPSSEYAGSLSLGIPVWQSEWSTFEAFSTDIGNGLGVAAMVHAWMTAARGSAFHYWWLLGQSTDNEGLIGYKSGGIQHYDVTKRAYCFGQFSRFIRPGHKRVDVQGTPPGGVSVSAYKGNGRVVVVAINAGASEATLDATVPGWHYTSAAAWRTSATEDLALLPALGVSEGVFVAALPAYSVTTFVLDPVVYTYVPVTSLLRIALQAGPGATIEVEWDGQAAATVTANGSGIASAEVEAGLGAHTIRARQTYQGRTSAWTALVHVTGAAA